MNESEHKHENIFIMYTKIKVKVLVSPLFFLQTLGDVAREILIVADGK